MILYNNSHFHQMGFILLEVPPACTSRDRHRECGFQRGEVEALRTSQAEWAELQRGLGEDEVLIGQANSGLPQPYKLKMFNLVWSRYVWKLHVIIRFSVGAEKNSWFQSSDVMNTNIIEEISLDTICTSFCFVLRGSGNEMLGKAQGLSLSDSSIPGVEDYIHRQSIYRTDRRKRASKGPSWWKRKNHTTFQEISNSISDIMLIRIQNQL